LENANKITLEDFKNPPIVVTKKIINQDYLKLMVYNYIGIYYYINISIVILRRYYLVGTHTFSYDLQCFSHLIIDQIVLFFCSNILEIRRIYLHNQNFSRYSIFFFHWDLQHFC